tara:strand:+ start:369 stop:887 length:519 start_codon:yes stop_codon:yes gene_type:complete
MKQITIEEFRQNLRESKSLLLKNLRKKMIVISAQMEHKLKNEPSFRRWKNDTGRLAQSIAGQYAIVSGKPSILLQAGGQMGGVDVNYAGVLEFGSPAQTIKVKQHTVRKHKVRGPKGTSTRGPYSRGPYSYDRQQIKGRFYLRRTVEWGTQQFPKDLRQVLTFALAGKNINA